MAISLDSIYQPLNSFFLQKFASSGDAAVIFRFAHLPRTFNDNDFLVPQHSDWGPWPGLADELFSIAVDAMPRLDDDGRTVWLSITSRLSDLYKDEILDPAIPFVPADVTDDTERQARTDAFNTVKADAVRLWDTIPETGSLLEGPAVTFRSSTATPSRWWDKTDASWTSQSFQVKGAATSPPQPGQPAQPPQPSNQLLRMKVSDTVLRSVVQSYTPAAAPPQPSTAPAAAFKAPIGARALFFRANPTVGQQIIAKQAQPAVATQEAAIPPIKSFPFNQRLQILSALATDAQTQPVATTDVTISFDYCVVDVRRDWLHMAFINNPSWRIPSQAKGQLSANDGRGLPALPVGFVAVKALKIQAPWTPEDITNLEQSVQFGPFNFDSQVVNGAIGHEGIQIIGWMLQSFPDLPPNDLSTPQDTPAPSSGATAPTSPSSGPATPNTPQS